jgi:hypothetical protein
MIKDEVMNSSVELWERYNLIRNCVTDSGISGRSVNPMRLCEP